MALAATAAAQTPAPGSTTTTTSQTAVTQDEIVLQGDATPRPALPSFYGDTGFWFVPSAETLPRGKWSFSAFRSQYDRMQGLTDVSQFGLTGAVALTDRFELFGSWRLERIDRDVRPIFASGDAIHGGVSQEYPYMRRGWSKTLGGPTVLGGKFNLVSQSRGDALAIAPRVMFSLPTGPPWGSTNDVEAIADLVVTREFATHVELSGFVGGIFRADPDEFNISDGIRWGTAAAFPTRTPIRALVEFHGEVATKDNTFVVASPYRSDDDGSIAPMLSPISDPKNLTFGGVWQAKNGFFVHAGGNYTLGGVGDHVIAGIPISHNPFGFEVRLGWHPGVTQGRQRVRVIKETTTVTNTVTPPVAAAAPAPPPNRAPTVTVNCNPCSVEPGQTSNLTASGTDPDGDAMTFRWNAPQGTFNNPGAPNTTWTAPTQEGNIPLTVTAQDSRGGTATGSTTVQVVRREAIMFEDVHFDFDRYNLRPEALKILDDAIARLQSNRDLNVTIEGHCDSIGTIEYNLALGERRANSVRDYLVNRGIAAARLRTVSYGEERPTADNSTAEGRAMNRRAHLAVIIQ